MSDPVSYSEYVASIRANYVVHFPGAEFTPCGIRYWKPENGTVHTVACIQGEERCAGIHVTAVGSSINPDLVNCPECLAKLKAM